MLFRSVALEGTKVAYKKLCALTVSTSTEDVGSNDATSLISDIKQSLYDDLNTPKAIGIIFEHLSSIKGNAALKTAVVNLLQDTLGLTLAPLNDSIRISPQIEILLQEREKARQNKDWARADALRAELTQLGYVVQDKKS